VSVERGDLDRRIASLSPEERADLEQRLIRRLAGGPGAARIPRRESPAEPCELSPAQERLWLLEQLEPGTAAYNVARAFRLRGRLDTAALAGALTEIVARHEALRTTFEAPDGRPRQVIAPAAPMPLPIEDLRGRRPEEREAEARRLAEEEAWRPFDLARGPLFRARLLRPADDEHVLVLALDHLVVDGWSMGVLFREISALYAAFAGGWRSPLAALPIQYADYAAWQRRRLDGAALEPELAYWRERLAGAPWVLELPTDRPRPPVPTHRGARLAISVPPALAGALKALGRREGATLYMTLLAAFQALLGRYTGRDDLLVGSPVAGRGHTDLEGLIGFFVNTLVLRADLAGDPSFRELLGRVRGVALGAFAHQALPFEKLVEALRPPRERSRAPLIQVLFALQNAPREALALPGLDVSPLELAGRAAKLDLVLSLREEDGGLRGHFEYAVDLFDEATVARLAGHFRTLLEGIVADPEQRVSELPLLTEPERQQLLAGWNATQAEYPREACVHELFEAQVERTPDAAAVGFEGQQLTYRELNRRANGLAHHLRRLGVGPEVLVGICVERSWEILVGLLGILKAGGAYVPLDPSYPKERLAFMLEDGQAPVLLTQRRLAGSLPDYGGQVVCLDGDLEAVAGAREENPVSGATPANLAYVIYTSGSTGRPKGVAVEHRSLANYLTWVSEALLGRTVQVLPTVTTLTFDASLKQVFGPLLQGGEVWVLPEAVAMEPAALLRAIRTRAGVGLNCVPTYWEAVLDALRSGRGPTPAGLDGLLLGGERFGQELVARSLAVLPNLQVWNFYGPTEATANAVVGRTGPGAEVTIGRPIANTRIYLLDRYLNPVPVGIPGELHIGGVGLARGYLSHPELTAERFIPDPFSAEPGARLYRTGDLARYRPDGQIEFLGRLDDQVKIRGFRIELGEIEAVLARHPVVRDAVVLAREDAPGDKRLVAYVVPDRAPAPTGGELRSFLKEQLPEYMVPAAFVPLEALPRSPNGKVDRRALPAPERVRPELESACARPRTVVEELLAGIWAEVLGLERVGIHDDFFDLGGHSLLAARLIARVGDAFHIDLPLRSLFEARTIARVAELIEARILETVAGLSEEAASQLVSASPGGFQQPAQLQPSPATDPEPFT
jgi:amino acid adenylation domain-containing protein